MIEKLFDRFDRRNSTPAAAPCRNGDRLTLLFDGLALPFDLSTGTQGLFGQSRLVLQPVFASFPLSVGTAGLGQLSPIAVKDTFCLALPSSEQGVLLVDFSRRLLVNRYREACRWPLW